MDILAAWVLFPITLALFALGSGLLLERVAGIHLPKALILPAGFAALMVTADLFTSSARLADLALPVVAVLASAGVVAGRSRLRPALRQAWAVAAAVGVFAVFGAPVFLSGEPSFAGSLILPDTANQFSLANRLPEAGHEFQSLPPSSYRRSLEKYFDSHYPVGAQATLGVLSPVGVVDLAWLYQPFLSFMAAITALALYSLLTPWIARRPLRAAAAFLAAQPALVVSYALQGSIKEVAAVASICLGAALIAAAISKRWPARALVVVVAVAIAAMFAAVGPVALAYFGPMVAIVGAVWVWRVARAPRRSELAWAGGALLAAMVLAYPVLTGASTAYRVEKAALTGAQDLGHLARPLELGQASGVWLSGDFRYAPQNSSLTFALIGVVAAAALLGLGWALRRRAFGPLLLILTLVSVSAYLLRVGSPYANAKVLMILSPAVLLAAVLGVLALADARRRAEATLLAVVLAGAVLGSNALAYHSVQGAPYHRYRELLKINERFAGKGPALFSEYDEYAGYMLRDARPYAIPEQPLVYAGPPARHPSGLADPNHHPSVKSPLDIDDLEPQYVQSVPTLVLRRSPTVSRPPANFRRVFTGRYYDVWRRERGPGAPEVRDHLALGADVFSPGGIPPCRDVRTLAREARRIGGELAYVDRPQLAMFDPLVYLLKRQAPARWFRFGAYPRALVPDGQGSLQGPVRLPQGGRVRLWLEGSFSRGVQVEVDGRKLGEVAYEPGNAGQYLLVGEMRLAPGSHWVHLFRGGGSLWPGNGGGSQSSSVHVGPLVFSTPVNEERTVRTVSASDAGKLCGRSLDWIEVVAPRGGA
jgi:hypothetical protein